MAIKSDNKKGNPYHDEEGKFTTSSGASTGASSDEQIERSIPNSEKSDYLAKRFIDSVIPKKTSSGIDRRFYDDYSIEEKNEIFRNYYEKNGALAKAISDQRTNFNTMNDNSESRQRLREKILVDEQESQMGTPKKAERKATILLGLPGSGKSTIASPLMSENGAFIIDADNFKARIPEFRNDSTMLSAVHEESVFLSNEFRKNLSKDGYNMIIGKVGGDYESIGYILDELADSGYDIEIVLNDVPLEVAMDRTIGRYDRKETNRLVPLATLLNADKNIFKTYAKALLHAKVSGGKIYSNDVPKGQKPILLKEIKKGKGVE